MADTEGNVTYTAYRDAGRWMEAVFQADDGILFGWYYNESAHLVPQEMHEGRRFAMTAPFIGAAVSSDNGRTWYDLGLVLAGGSETLHVIRLIRPRRETEAGGAERGDQEM